MSFIRRLGIIKPVSLRQFLLLFQIAVKLSQVEGVEGGELRPLLDVVISNMKADVVDRKWDSQGSVAMGEISILDYITPGRSLCELSYHLQSCQR